MEHISKHLIPAKQLEKRELQKLESQPQKNGDEKLFVKCLRNPQIIQRPIEELKEVLRLVMIKVGLRANNWPNEVEKAVLLDHIVKHFGNHTHEEIILAFDLAINGKLDFLDKDGANHFENFSCAYFSKIMASYRVWAALTYRSVIKEPVKTEKENPEISDEEMDKFWNDTEALIKKGGQLEIIPSMLYDWMDKNGNILISKEEKRGFFEGAVMHMNGILAKEYEKNPSNLEIKERLVLFNRMRETKCYSEKEVKILQDISKKMVVYKMMKA